MNAECEIISLCKGTELLLYSDGTYSLRHTDDPSEYPYSTSLIQCYSNGCVNKVSVNDLIALRYDYIYSHGIYPLSNLLVSSIVSPEDNIYVKYLRNGTERTANMDVQTIKSHSMLGLKGIDIIGTTFDEITGWYLNGKLISEHSESMRPIDTNEQCVSESVETVIPKEYLGIYKIENNDSLEEKFNEFLKDGRNIPIGQQYAKDVLSHCQSKEEFWHVIRTLFKCDTHIYRSPVVEYLKECDVTHFMPSAETLSSICEQLFSITTKPEKNLEFLYHFKDILTGEIKERIARSNYSFSQPDLYFKLCDMLGMSTKELIEYCIKQSNAAAFYCIYEMLLKVHKKDGYFAVSKLITSYINNLDSTSIKGDIIKRLIYSEFKKVTNNPDEEVTKIKAGGFNEYLRLCTSHEGKEKNQTIQNSITSNVRKKIYGKYVATYSNHYFLMTSNGIRILLPKIMSEKALSDGDSAKVQIVYADRAYSTLYATQKSAVDYIKVKQIPLLNNGDIIEISFDIHGEPVPHKCYKRIKINLESYPKKIENKARYKAKVIRQTIDKYHYLVKII